VGRPDACGGRTPRLHRAGGSWTRPSVWVGAPGTQTSAFAMMRLLPRLLVLLRSRPPVLVLPQPLEAAVVVRQRKRHAGGSWTRPSAWVGAPGTQTSAFATTRRPPQPPVLLQSQPPVMLPQPPVLLPRRLEAEVVVRQRKHHAGGSWTQPSVWVGAPGTQTSAFVTTRQPPQPPVLLQSQPLVLLPQPPVLLPQPLEEVAVVRQRPRRASQSWTRPSVWVGAPGTQTSAFATTRQPPQPLVLLQSQPLVLL
jgi:hypothetical protein